MTYRTLGIVLNRRSIQENNRVYILYSRHAGKIEAVARGSRKILSKLAPHLEPPIISDIMVARGKRIDKLAGAKFLKSYPKIKSDFFKIQIVFSCFKVLDLLTRFNQKDEKIYNLLEKFLKTCEDTGKAVFDERGKILQNAFFIKLLAFLGYNPVDHIKKSNIEVESKSLQEIKYLLGKTFEEILNSSFTTSDKTKEEISLFIQARRV